VFDISSRAARKVAFLAAVANALAGAAIVFVLRLGLPPQGLSARSAFISSHQVLWRLGWLGWNVAAITLLGLFLALASRWRSEAPFLCGLAIVVATAGLAADLGAEGQLAGFTGSTLGNLSLVQSEALLLTGRATRERRSGARSRADRGLQPPSGQCHHRSERANSATFSSAAMPSREQTASAFISCEAQRRTRPLITRMPRR
jgi:hypothetical protein